ncbi:MAG: amino acid permease [bacterium]
MAILHKSKRLKKELSLFNVYALATGATLSSGFFLLPGLAAAQAGPAVTLSYLIAALHLIPAVFSMAELSTAMPRSGGIYYYVDRSMGPLWGTISGLGTWLALILKTAFALIGMGAYVELFFPELPLIPLAIALALIFGMLNLLGAKKTGKFQVLLVVGLLISVLGFCFRGLFALKMPHFSGYFAQGFDSIYATAGLVYISYVGLTNIASVSEEVKNPEKNLPLGMMLALVTAILIYGVGTWVMAGVLPPHDFYHDITPVASTAERLAGKWGAIVMTVAAVIAFFSVSNAAILSASRYPLAMSRDHLLPRFFRILTKHRTPRIAIYTTVGLIILALILFDATKIAKLASAFQLMLFALSCLAVIIMRESRLASYDPGYRSPWYPWMQIIGIVAPLFLIFEMGKGPLFFTLALAVAAVCWYYFYARKKVKREGAIYHIFARLGERQDHRLDVELRGILQEKGLRDKDPFDVVIARASFVDIEGEVRFEDIVAEASSLLSQRLNLSGEKLIEGFMQGTRVGATPVSHGVALPHLRMPKIKHPELVMVRSRHGVFVEVDKGFLGEHTSDKPVYAFFFLISSEEDASQHLRLLAQIAELAADNRFLRYWLACKNEHEIKKILHQDERLFYVTVHSDAKTASMVGCAVRDLKMPSGSLIAIIHRTGEIVIPRGRTVLKEKDRLTIIGEAAEIQKLKKKFGEN